jgi:hypothetical protein
VERCFKELQDETFPSAYWLEYSVSFNGLQLGAQLVNFVHLEGGYLVCESALSLSVLST